MVEISEIGAEWVCLMPYAYGPESDGSLTWDISSWQWWGERKEGTRAMIRMAHEKGLKVMVKPHLWLHHGFFTGTYMAGSEAEWTRFEQDYQHYILSYAALAEEEGVELLCIGTELALFVATRTNFWHRLVDKVTDIYSGPITYAANWDEVHRFPLWTRLSYVGVDGYFPLTAGPNGDKREMKTSWKSRMAELDQLCDSVGSQVLFCEIGYRSCVGCAEKPWEHDGAAEIDHQCQIDAFECFFEAADESEHCAGSFLWKWFAKTDMGRRQETGYTPQNKPVMSLIKREFSGN
jgi:hypothetical protein